MGGVIRVNYMVAVCGDVIRVKTKYLCEWSSYIFLLIGKRQIIKLLFDVVTF